MSKQTKVRVRVVVSLVALCGAAILALLVVTTSGDGGPERPARRFPPEQRPSQGSVAGGVSIEDPGASEAAANGEGASEGVVFICRFIDAVSGAPVEQIESGLSGRFPTDWREQGLGEGWRRYELGPGAASDPNLCVWWRCRTHYGGQRGLLDLMRTTRRPGENEVRIEIPVEAAARTTTRLCLIDSETGTALSDCRVARFLRGRARAERGALGEALVRSDQNGLVEIPSPGGSVRFGIYKKGYIPLTISIGNMPADLGDVPMQEDRWLSKLVVGIGGELPKERWGGIIHVLRIGPDEGSLEFQEMIDGGIPDEVRWNRFTRWTQGDGKGWKSELGRWEGAFLIPGDYVVIVRHAGRGCYRQDLRLLDSDIELKVGLEEGTTVRIVPHGSTQNVASVSLDSTELSLAWSAVSGCTLPHVTRGRYRVVLHLKSGARVSTETIIDVGDERDLTVQLEDRVRLYVVRGRIVVRSRRGDPMPVNRLKVQLLGTGLCSVTDDEGNFEVVGCPRGTYTVRVLDYFRASQGLQCTVGGTTEVVDVGELLIELP